MVDSLVIVIESLSSWVCGGCEYGGVGFCMVWWVRTRHVVIHVVHVSSGRWAREVAIVRSRVNRRDATRRDVVVVVVVVVVMDARVGRWRGVDVERGASHRERWMRPRHRPSSSTHRRARDGRGWRAEMGWLARCVALCACAWLVFGGGERGGGGGGAIDGGGGGGASRRARASGRPRATTTTTTTVDGMRRERERAAVETATRAEATLEALKREHEAIELARVAAEDEDATDRTARGVGERRDVSSSSSTRGAESLDDHRARGAVLPPNVVTADGGEERREDEETPTRDDVADEETVIGSIEDELRAIRESAKPMTSVADDRAPTLAIDPTRVRTISLNSPRAYVYEGFLTEEECDHMLELSQGRLTKSGVVDVATGGSTTSDIRTSTGTFIARKRDDVIARIEKRIELWSHVPETHGEAFQVLRYQHGQEYKAHFDYFFHKSGMRNNRIATVLLYLSDVEEGGETVFPNTDAPTNRDTSKFSECGNLGRSVKARKGDALLFWGMKPGGELDPGSSHAGCPVIKGEKWTATKWMHVNPLGAPGDDVHKIFYDGGPLPTPACKDANDACAGWAQSGECAKNPGFMHTSCAMSCRLCQGHWRDGGYEKPNITAALTTNKNTH